MRLDGSEVTIWRDKWNKEVDFDEVMTEVMRRNRETRRSEQFKDLKACEACGEKFTREVKLKAHLKGCSIGGCS